MNKINLDIQPVFKLVNINGKDIKIPKLGLKHHAILSNSVSFEDGTKKLLTSIHKNLTMAERDLVTLHLLHFNGKLKDSVIIDGNEYTLNDVFISQQLKFYINDVEYRFKTPSNDDLYPTIDKVLNACCVSVKLNGNDLEIPDFMEMPAFTYKWLDKIMETISLKVGSKEYRGLNHLMEIFK